MISRSVQTIESVKEVLLPVLLRHHVKRAGVFGSLVHGDWNSDSDIDLLVEIDEPISLLGLARIERELGEAIGRRIDLVEYRAIKPRIKGQILEDEVRIL